MTPLDYAWLYASLRWHTFPVVARTKEPRPGSHAKDDATTDREILNRWFRDANGSTPNVGIACGPSQIVVIDPDPPREKNGFTDGGIELASLIQELGPLPPTVTANTGGGGTHYLFRAPAGVKLRGKLGKAIDLISNGYIVAPPSVHPSGGVYCWRDGHAPDEIKLSELPASWIDYAREPEPQARPASRGQATGDDLYDALASMDQRDVLLHLSGTWLVKGERIAFTPVRGNGKCNLLVDKGDGFEGTSNFIAADGTIGARNTGNKDGGPLASHWLRWYGHTDQTIRNGLAELVPELARFIPRAADPEPPPSDPPPPSAEPPPTEPPKPKKKPREKRPGAVGQAVAYVAKFAAHSDGPTLRRWRGDWYRWAADRGHYAPVSDERIDASLYRDFKLSRPVDAHEVRAALIAVDGVLIDDTEIGTWIDRPANDVDQLQVAACPNGLLHLRDRTLTRATPAYFATTALGVAYDPKAPTPVRWLAFLRQLWPNGDESISALQEWFGYLLTPDTRQQKIMLLVGPKRSGKGTIMRILSALLGNDSVAAPTLASLGSNFGLWPLIGRTAAIIGDARLGGRSDIAQIVERLLSLSGQDRQTIDRKHREPWTGYLSARMTIVSNELPRFSDASDALASRMLILELEQTFFGREDTGLTERLYGELPGILQWAIDGWDRLRLRGHFLQPKTSAQLVNDLIDLASPVSAWVRSNCIKEPDAKMICTEAYANYQNWCASEGHQHRVTLQTFGRDLKAAAGIKRVREPDGARDWIYERIRLRHLKDEIPVFQD